MTSRDAILQAIRAAQPEPVPLPDVSAFGEKAETRGDGQPAPHVMRGPPDLASLFVEALTAAGGQVESVDREGIAGAIEAAYPDVRLVASLVPEVAGTLALDEVEGPQALADVDLLACEAALGVAENGAMWLGERQMGHRAAPFIAQHLVIVLAKQALVPTMHEAYARLDVAEEGFGVFVAGPSKTADIEQSLVIGAHGPRSLLILLVG